MFSKKITLAVLLAASAYAQDTSSTSSGPLPTSSLTPCILNCATTTPGCVFSDASCVCVNQTYQQAVLQCLTANCTSEEVQAAMGIQQALCGGSSSSSSGSASLPTSSISSRLSSVLSSVSSRVSSASSRLSSATNSPTGTGSTGGANAGYTASFLAAGGAVLLGVIGGGMLVF